MRESGGYGENYGQGREPEASKEQHSSEGRLAALVHERRADIRRGGSRSRLREEIMEMFGGFSEDPERAEERCREFLNTADAKLKIEDRLALIQLLETAVADEAFEDFYEYDPERAVAGFLKQRRNDPGESAFVRYAARQIPTESGPDADAPISAIRGRQTFGMMLQDGAFAHRGTALVEYARAGEESRAIGQAIMPEGAYGPDGMLRRMARDAVASCDKDGTPEGFALVAPREFRARKNAVSAGDVAALSAALDAPNTQRYRDDDLLRFAYARLARPRGASRPAKELRAMLPWAEDKDLRRYAALRDAEDELGKRTREMEVAAYARAEAETRTAEDNFFAEFHGRLDELREAYRGDAEAREALERFAEHYPRGYDGMQEALGDLAFDAEGGPRWTSGPLGGLAARYAGVAAATGKIAAQAANEVSAARFRLAQEDGSAERRHELQEIETAVIGGDSSRLRGAMREYATTAKNALRLPTAVFMPLAEMDGNERVLPKGSAGETDIATLLRELHRPAMRDAVERGMGLSLAALSTREQVQLLSFLARADARTTEHAFAAIREYGVDCARAFLSCEYGKGYGDAVLEIAASLGRDGAMAVFRRYAQVTDAVDAETAALLAAFYEKDPGRQADRAKINDELLSRAKEIIASFATRARQGQPDADGAEIARALDHFKKDTMLFASVFKEAAKGGEIGLDGIRGLSLERSAPTELPGADKTRMREIVAENWRGHLPKAADFVISGFDRALAAREGTTFSVLRKDGGVIAFVRLDERPDLGPNALYAGSLNVRPDLRGAAISEALLRKTVDEAAKSHVVHADFFPEVAAGTMYVEQFGWVVTGAESVPVTGKEGAPLRRLTMRRDDAQNALYRSRRPEVTPDMLAEWTDGGAPKSIRVLRFSFPEEQEAFVDAVADAAASGQAMTRYFSDPADKRVRYAAFEAVPSPAEAPPSP